MFGWRGVLGKGWVVGGRMMGRAGPRSSSSMGGRKGLAPKVGRKFNIHQGGGFFAGRAGKKALSFSLSTTASGQVV